jgi:gluconolactonase
MYCSAIVMALLCVPPAGEQLALLKTFRGEFVEMDVQQSGLAPFAIGKYEVTQDLWQAVLGANPSKWKGPRNSVEMLSLSEAHKFCSEVTRSLQEAGLIQRGEVVRLPTEEEWEFAARAGTKTKYSFGDDATKLGEYGWYNGNAAGNDPPVGAKKPNSFGLYDMHGYLWEWAVGADAEQGVVRGGSWKDAAELLTSDSRQVVQPTLSDDAVGLRCVLAKVERGAVTVVASDEKGTNKAPVVKATTAKVTVEEPIVPVGAKLEMLWNEGEFTEGPALAPDGSIFFSDIGETIYRFDPQSKQTSVFRRPSGRTNGLMFNQRGELVACEGANTGGNRRISLTTGIDGGKDGTVRALAERFDGKRFNSPNDLVVDGQGRVYFSDPRYVGSEPRELDFEAVYLVGTDGSVKVATREVSKPNGIVLSPDGNTAYVSDNNPQGNRHLVAFDVGADGLLTRKRVLHDFGSGRGVDGMTIDTRGNVFATAGTGEKGGVYVFDSSGKQLAVIPTPGDPTNCVFGGGENGSTLYVTCANGRGMGVKYGLYSIRLNAVGHHVVRIK